MVRPWRNAGFDSTQVDLQHDGLESLGSLRLIGEDVRTWVPCDERYSIVFAFPPCTDLANSGARWLRNKGLGSLIDALQVVQACIRICEASGAPWMIENPMGQLSTYWRKPDMVFDPYEFAGYLDDPEQDFYTKRTCLWVGGGFQLPLKRPWGAGGDKAPSRMHLLAPSPDRGDERAVTPAGFAQAVFEANAPRIVDGLAGVGAHSDQGAT